MQPSLQNAVGAHGRRQRFLDLFPREPTFALDIRFRGVHDQAVILDDPVYAITSQTSDFKNLEPKKILGMITTNQTKNSTDDTLEIFRVGVTPKYAYSQNKNSRDVKHIGTALVKKLVEILHRKTDIKRVVAVAEEPSEVNFLQKLNMKEKSSNFRYTNFELNKENFDEFVK